MKHLKKITVNNSWLEPGKKKERKTSKNTHFLTIFFVIFLIKIYNYFQLMYNKTKLCLD